jgi:hypothetical protein
MIPHASTIAVFVQWPDRARLPVVAWLTDDDLGHASVGVPLVAGLRALATPQAAYWERWPGDPDMADKWTLRYGQGTSQDPERVRTGEHERRRPGRALAVVPTSGQAVNPTAEPPPTFPAGFRPVPPPAPRRARDMNR